MPQIGNHVSKRTPTQMQAEIDRLRKLAHDTCFTAAMLAGQVTDGEHRQRLLCEIAAQRAQIETPAP